MACKRMGGKSVFQLKAHVARPQIQSANDILIPSRDRLGYHFQSKCWVELDVNKVRDIEKLKDDSAFKSLELPKTQKELIGRLVSCHGVKNEDRSMRDLMKGKGNGLVILLHGTILSLSLSISY